jgi:hypothetical protein
MEVTNIYQEFEIMVETDNDLAHLINFMDFVNKYTKTNSIMNDDDDGVSAFDAVTACCTENLYHIPNPNALGIPVHDYYYFGTINFFCYNVLSNTVYSNARNN